MTPEQFTYWLQGIMEFRDVTSGFTPEQAVMIQEHLNTVFDKITPDWKETERILASLTPQTIPDLSKQLSFPLTC